MCLPLQQTKKKLSTKTKFFITADTNKQEFYIIQPEFDADYFGYI
jgi:hypothetical protein